MSKNDFKTNNISSSKNKEESKENHFPFTKVNEPPKEPPKKFDTHSTKVYHLKPIVPDKIPIPENKEKSPPKESKVHIQQIDPHPKNSNIPIIPLQTIPEVSQQLENKPSSDIPPHMGQDLNQSNLPLSPLTENNVSLRDLKSINSSENPQINIDIMNAKVLEEQPSANNLSNGNALTNLNSDMNTSQIIYRMEDGQGLNQKTMDFSFLQPSKTFDQILASQQQNPFLSMNQNVTTIIPIQLKNIFNNDAVQNAPNPLNVNTINPLQNFSNNPPISIFPPNQHLSIFSNDHLTQNKPMNNVSFQPQNQLPMFYQQNFNHTSMNQQNAPLFNPPHSQTINSLPNDYHYQNHQQPNIFVPSQNQNSFLESSTNNMETNGHLHDISFGHGPEIQMSNTNNNNNIYDTRMMTNQQNFNGTFGQNLYTNTNNNQNNNQMMMGSQSNLFSQNYGQIDTARSLFSNKPNNNNNLNIQPIAAANLFAPQNNNVQNPKNYAPSGDPTQDRMLNKKNENAKLRANNINY